MNNNSTITAPTTNGGSNSKMKVTFDTLLLSVLILMLGCNSDTSKQGLINSDIIPAEREPITGKNQFYPRIIYVIYGYYCGRCVNNCPRMYKHFLIGNATTFWTDKADSNFRNEELQFETEMDRESERVGLELINNIPASILKSDSTRNIYGCPGCNDGCVLYFEFQLDKPNSQPVAYEMKVGLNNTSGDVRELGERIKKTLKKLEEYH